MDKNQVGAIGFVIIILFVAVFSYIYFHAQISETQQEQETYKYIKKGFTWNFGKEITFPLKRGEYSTVYETMDFCVNESTAKIQNWENTTIEGLKSTYTNLTYTLYAENFRDYLEWIITTNPATRIYAYSRDVIEINGEKFLTYRYLEALKFGNVDGVDTNVTVTVSGFASWTEVIRYKGE